MPAMSQNLNLELLGSRIRSRRKTLHIAQKKLASMLGCSSTHLSNVEHNYTIPSLEFVMQACSLLGVTPDYFLLGIDRIGDDEDNNSEIQDKLRLCTKEQRHLVSRFLDILVEENQPQKL